jgi:hypothetical protein
VVGFCDWLLSINVVFSRVLYFGHFILSLPPMAVGFELRALSCLSHICNLFYSGYFGDESLELSAWAGLEL